MCSSIEDFKIQTKINFTIHLFICWLRTFAKQEGENTQTMRTHFCVLTTVHVRLHVHSEMVDFRVSD